MTPAENTRDAYLRWMRTAAFAFAAPFALIALAQVLASAGPARYPVPAGLRSALLAFGVGAVLFGRSFARRIPLAPAGATHESALALIRSTSWTLVGFAVAPCVLGIALVALSHAPGDALLMLLLSLAGFVLLFPRAAQWQAWYSHLTAPAQEVPHR